MTAKFREIPDLPPTRRIARSCLPGKHALLQIFAKTGDSEGTRTEKFAVNSPNQICGWYEVPLPLSGVCFVYWEKRIPLERKITCNIITVYPLPSKRFFLLPSKNSRRQGGAYRCQPLPRPSPPTRAPGKKPRGESRRAAGVLCRFSIPQYLV